MADRFLQLLQLHAHFPDRLQLVQVAARELIRADMHGRHHLFRVLRVADGRVDVHFAFVVGLHDFAVHCRHALVGHDPGVAGISGAVQART
ncbi:MAG: hypothetical protein QF497_06315, partial [Verrucomicrobiota bacterium]|nr:hypothetical protein [Verrucomicrobiota bacterium]